MFRAALLGHSYVCSFDDYLRSVSKKENIEYLRINEHISKLSFVGRRGGFVKDYSNESSLFEQLKSIKPNLVIIELGRNELSIDVELSSR